MSEPVRLTIDDRALQRRLARLGDSRRVELIAKKAVRAALKPALPLVKEASPIDIGNLRRSLSVHISGGWRVTGYIWPRKAFKPKERARKTNRASSRQAESRRCYEAMGMEKPVDHPTLYASIVEESQPFIRPTVQGLRPSIEATLRSSIDASLRAIR